MNFSKVTLLNMKELGMGCVDAGNETLSDDFLNRLRSPDSRGKAKLA
jgi:hypothetical protein